MIFHGELWLEKHSKLLSSDRKGIENWRGKKFEERAPLDEFRETRTIGVDWLTVRDIFVPQEVY